MLPLRESCSLRSLTNYPKNTTEYTSTLLEAATSQDLALYHTHIHTHSSLSILQPLSSFSWPVLRLNNYSFYSLPATYIIPSLLPRPLCLPTCSTHSQPVKHLSLHLLSPLQMSPLQWTSRHLDYRHMKEFVILLVC